jgi:hypothetical protein
MAMQLDFSNPVTIAVLIGIVVLILMVVGVILQSRKKARLRERFGTEYDRTVSEMGAEKAHARLEKREAEVEKLKLRELLPAQRDRFVADWTVVQGRFVDHPKGALIEADELVSSLLQARGYPVANFEQNAEYLSVSHGGMMEDFRSAHAVMVRSERGEASTEELRTAMIRYRGLFDELVGTAVGVR